MPSVEQIRGTVFDFENKADVFAQNAQENSWTPLPKETIAISDAHPGTSTLPVAYIRTCTRAPSRLSVARMNPAPMQKRNGTFENEQIPFNAKFSSVAGRYLDFPCSRLTGVNGTKLTR